MNEYSGQNATFGDEDDNTYGLRLEPVKVFLRLDDMLSGTSVLNKCSPWPFVWESCHLIEKPLNMLCLL